MLESNHTPDFWNIVSVQLTHYEKAKEWLKKMGTYLS